MKSVQTRGLACRPFWGACRVLRTGSRVPLRAEASVTVSSWVCHVLFVLARLLSGSSVPYGGWGMEVAAAPAWSGVSLAFHEHGAAQCFRSSDLTFFFFLVFSTQTLPVFC